MRVSHVEQQASGCAANAWCQDEQPELGRAQDDGHKQESCNQREDER